MCPGSSRRKKSSNKKFLPPPEVKLQLLKRVIERLTEDNRYVYIGMDHFARPTDELAVAQSTQKTAAKFPGLQHACRCGYLRFRHVSDFANPRRLLAE